MLQRMNHGIAHLRSHEHQPQRLAVVNLYKTPRRGSTSLQEASRQAILCVLMREAYHIFIMQKRHY